MPGEHPVGMQPLAAPARAVRRYSNAGNSANNNDTASPAPGTGVVVDSMSPPKPSTPTNREADGGAATAAKPAEVSKGRYAVVITLCLLCGLMFGAGIVMIPLYLTYNPMSRACSDFKSEAACAASKFGECVWTTELGAAASAGGGNASTAAATPSCRYPDFRTVDCGQFRERDTCSGACVWDTSDAACYHALGFDAVQSGLFAASYFIGTTVGPLTVNAALHYMLFKPTLLMYGCFGVFGTVLMHIARATDTFAIFFIGFFFFGLSAASARLVTTIFAFATIPDPVQAGVATGVLQPAAEFGQLIGALYIYFAQPSDLAVDPKFETRIHCFLIYWHMLALSICVVGGIIAKEPSDPPPPENAAKAVAAAAMPPVVGAPLAATPDTSDGGDGQTAVAAPIPMPEPPQTQRARGAVPLPPQGLLRPLLAHKGVLGVGMTLGASLLFTGLPAINQFSPLYSKQLFGIPAVKAPLLTAGAGACSGLVAMVLRRIITNARPVMLVGTAGLFVIDIFYATIASPGVVEDAGARHGLAIFAVCAFFIFCEACVGPTFFELALSIQPPEVRAGGAAVLNASLNVYSIIISFVFPVATSAISGGPSGDQLRGYATCFYFFGAVALLCFFVQYPFMHPYVAPDTQKSDDQPAVGSRDNTDEEEDVNRLAATSGENATPLSPPVGFIGVRSAALMMHGSLDDDEGGAAPGVADVDDERDGDTTTTLDIVVAPCEPSPKDRGAEQAAAPTPDASGTSSALQPASPNAGDLYVEDLTAGQERQANPLSDTVEDDGV